MPIPPGLPDAGPPVGDDGALVRREGVGGENGAAAEGAVDWAANETGDDGIAQCAAGSPSLMRRDRWWTRSSATPASTTPSESAKMPPCSQLSAALKVSTGPK